MYRWGGILMAPSSFSSGMDTCCYSIATAFTIVATPDNYQGNGASLCEIFITFSVLFQSYILDPEDFEHKQLFKLIESMLEYEPNHRIKLCDALKDRFFRRLYKEEPEPEEPPTEGDGEERARSHSLSR